MNTNLLKLNLALVEVDTLPSGPEPRESDPEGSIERSDAGPRLAPSVDRELLPKGELDDGLLLAGTEEGSAASKNRDPESSHRPHHRDHSARDRWA